MLSAFLKKHKEKLLYLFFGGVTTAVNLITYYILRTLLSVPLIPSNILAWIVAVSSAFVTNKLFVFESRSWKKDVWLKEAGEFLAARLFSLAFDTAFLYIAVELLHLPDMTCKILSNVIVIVLNYLFSKWIIFKHSKKELLHEPK